MGECLKIKDTISVVNNPSVDLITNRSKLGTNLKGTRPMLTSAVHSTIGCVNTTRKTFKSQPQVLVKSSTKTRNFELVHVGNNETQELGRNNIINSTVDNKIIERKTAVGCVGEAHS